MKYHPPEKRHVEVSQAELLVSVETSLSKLIEMTTDEEARGRYWAALAALEQPKKAKQ